MPEPTIDFRGLAAAAAAAAKPDYADVLARAERRRHRRGWFGTTFVVLAVAIGGGTTFALTADRVPRPAPVAEVRPWKTVVPPGATAPKPQISYIEIKPGLWDPKYPDKPLTGIFPEIKAGDLNHLYMNYQDCRAKPCKAMLAASSDRGRTWRKLPLPRQDRPQFAQPGVMQASGSTLVAASGFAPRSSEGIDSTERFETEYWVSADAGVTWRKAKARDADALPIGQPVHQRIDGDTAFDPATGDVVRVRRDRLAHLDYVETLTGNELWALVPADRSHMAASISVDGGRTWEKRLLPALPPVAHGAPMRSSLFTTDGRTVYFAERLRDSIKLYASGDGARTWSEPVPIDLNGPLLGVLPVGDRTVIVQSAHDVLRSTDGGRTFTRVGPSIGGFPRPIPGGGYIINTNNNEYSAWISEDGAEWTYVNHPPVP
ncbi:exo-alpha-sialidase [Actinoplanes sp. NBRC 103695]|uniref:exo-alpha-sialidase n=1 Tax=Actinoplanes sp. NBRC 103695 TaxID=3032202 RepID=UPI0024A3418A|nr:exo-alpha-sialidase [Actinoplanes sp. NBRC 103695]GLY99368.1 hypothetical protein Acsp02_66210 [Actinoplanes sp. NBRC 103695]